MNIVTMSDDLINETSNFATKVFVDYYSDLINDKQAKYMANLFLTETKIKELKDNGAIFRLVYDNKQIVGFTEYIKEENKVFLSKLYVAQQKRHTGIGRLMFEDCINYAKTNELNKIYLTVNKGNLPSIEIYKHLGFKQIDAVVNDIGGGYVMDDYIMEYTIK